MTYNPADYGVKPLTEVTEERFDEMLNVLPPSKWRGGAGAQSFHLCEYLSGNIVLWLMELNGRYFQCQDVDSLTHVELMERARAFATTH